MTILSSIINLKKRHQKSFKKKLTSLIGFRPKNIILYKMALKCELPNINSRENSERLEFLGDSILNLVTSEFLYKKHSDWNQGLLSENKAKIINNKHLTSLFFSLKINLLFDNQKIFSKKFYNKKLPADILEAIIGAIYLDRDFKKTKQFIIDSIIFPSFEKKDIENSIDNYKGKLLIWNDKNKKKLEFIHTEYNPSKKNNKFKVLIKIDDKIMASSYGSSKREAEQKAAKNFYIKNKLENEV